MSDRKLVCMADEIEDEDVRRFDVGDNSYAIVRSPDGEFFAIDGWCSHEKTHLADGLVVEFEIECPRHFGSFDYRSGVATVAPACEALRTYKVEVEDGKVFLLV